MSSGEDFKFRIGIHRGPLRPSQSTGSFVRAAADYSRLGIDCFNQCVDPDNNFSVDTLRGMEKRCMDGCLTVNLQNFTIYGTQYGR